MQSASRGVTKVILKLLFSAALACSAAAISAQESEWTEIAESERGTKFYIRFSEMLAFKNNEDIRRIWVKTDSTSVRNSQWNSSMSEYFFRCSTKSFRTGSGVAYLRNGTSRRLGAEITYSPVIPETVTEFLFDLTCAAYSG